MLILIYIFCRIRDLLGKEAEGESISELRENFKLPYKIVPTSKDNPRAAILSDKGDIISGEELAVCYFHYKLHICLLFIGSHQSNKHTSIHINNK